MRSVMVPQLVSDFVPLIAAAVVIFGALRLIQWAIALRGAASVRTVEPPGARTTDLSGARTADPSEADQEAGGS